MHPQPYPVPVEHQRLALYTSLSYYSRGILYLLCCPFPVLPPLRPLGLLVYLLFGVECGIGL